jgi:anaerobic selenocysteine-containing dehydrogenase
MKLSGKKLTELVAFNRRNFIKLLIGGAAGITVTPLPWKLTDDIAIWTENWSWVPSPKRGAFNYVDSVCTLCPGGCGISVRKVDKRAVKIEDRKDYPINPGGLCPVGFGGLQLLYDESIRFTGPMKRVGPRGAGEFLPLSWDKAIAEMAGRLANLRKQGSPQAVAAVDGNRENSTVSTLIQRFMDAIGSPNYERVPSVESTYEMVNTLMLGNKGPMAYDVENSDFVLSFGCGLIEGWGAPGRMIYAWRLWHGHPLRRNVKIVQVESRASTTASKADRWVAVKPGTEAALALGIAHVMVKEGLYDKEFVSGYAFGFDDWTSEDGKNHMGLKSLVFEKYSPETVSKITGAEAGDIVSLARDFAKAKAPIALCGKDKGYLNGGLFEFMAIHSLNALVGNVNKPGGILVWQPMPLGILPDFKPDAVAQEGLKTGRLDEAGSPRYPFTHSLVHNLAERINKTEKSPVNTLLVFSSNPGFTLPHGGSFREALENIPFIVSFSPYKDDTAQMADLILPDHTYLEKMNDVVWPTGLQYPFFAMTQPVVEPLYNTRNTGDVIIQLARQIGQAVGSAFPWKSFEEVLKTRVKGLAEADSGLTHYDGSTPVWKRMASGMPVSSDYQGFDALWKEMKKGGFWYRPVHRYGDWGNIFATPSGKFEFYSRQIQSAVFDIAKKEGEQAALRLLGIQAKGDEAFMPHYEPVKPEGEGTRFPFVMVPYGMINLSSNWLPPPPFLYKTLTDDQLKKKESFAEINPRTAAEHKLKEGDLVMVESPSGRAKVQIHLFEGAMPGVVYLPMGFGHAAYDEFINGKGASPNQVVSGGRDPLSGYPIWWSTPVRFQKV